MPIKKHLPLILIIAGILVTILVVGGGLGAAYYFMNKDYNTHLDEQKVAVATLGRQLEQGGGSQAATLKDECDLYDKLDSDVAALSSALNELNKDYPLLPGKATDESLGIPALSATMGGLKPKIAQLRECISEDESVASALTGLLNEKKSGKAGDYKALTERNQALSDKAAALKFTGSLEEKRTAFGDLIARRGAALDYFIEEAAIETDLDAFSADGQTGLNDLITKFGNLLAQNTALQAKAGGLNLQGVADGVNAAGAADTRGKAIQVYIDYLTELSAFQGNLTGYCALLDKTAATGKFAQRLAKYISWVNKLNEFDKQLQGINNKSAYAAVAGKRTLETLGLSDKAKMVLSYRSSLTTVYSMLSTSSGIEKQITALIKNTKSKPASKKSTAQLLATRNQNVINGLAVSVPTDLKAGLAKIVAGCKERAKFFNSYIAYLDAKAAADTHYASYKSHDNKAEDYAANGLYFLYYIDGYWSSTVEYYYQQMKKEDRAASAEKSKYNTYNSRANAHKKAYEASRKKYTPMLNP